MDYSNRGALYRDNNDFQFARPLEPIPDIDPATRRTPRLHKKRSYAGLRSQIHHLSGIPDSEADDGYVRFNPTSGLGDGAKARKPSIRNAVRKMFGRRGKENEPVAEYQKPYPRHGHHRSEPNTLTPPVELPHPDAPIEAPATHRVLSAPLQINAALSNRSGPGGQRSPYALEFPRSAKLKPLNLAAPFAVTPAASPIRRRKTLPSLVLDQSDMVEPSNLTKPRHAPPVPYGKPGREPPSPDSIVAPRRSKRMSRSADDLKLSLEEKSPPRKRSEEIRYWRDNLQQGGVLRASGFVVPPPEESQPSREGRTTMARAESMFDQPEPKIPTTERQVVSQPDYRFNEADFRSTSGYGTELSKDLEERVAKLELGLDNFQRSLARLAIERTRTSTFGERMSKRRSSTDARTPSMLIDSLIHGSMDPSVSNPQYRPESPERPKTSPQSPQTPKHSIRSRSSAGAPPVPTMDEPNNNNIDLFTSATPPGIAVANLGTRRDETQPKPMADYSFRSLYEMLADERAARRKLESQLKTLKREIDDLHSQVSVQSNIQSQRSSYLIDPIIGSSRLRDLIRSADSSLSVSSAESDHFRRQRAEDGLGLGLGNRDSATGFDGLDERRVVSRFSISESEAGLPEDLGSPPTPYELYQTPREERWRFVGGDDAPAGQEVHRTGEGGMF